MSWCYCKKKNAKKMHVKPERLTASLHCKGEEKQPVQLKCFLIASIALKKQRGKDPVSIAGYKRQIRVCISSVSLLLPIISIHMSHPSPLFTAKKKRLIHKTADLSGSLWVNCRTLAHVWVWRSKTAATCEIIICKMQFPTCSRAFST